MRVEDAAACCSFARCLPLLACCCCAYGLQLAHVVRNANVDTADTLKDTGVHSKPVPEFVLPDPHIQHTTQNMESCLEPDCLEHDRL